MTREWLAQANETRLSALRRILLSLALRPAPVVALVGSFLVVSGHTSSNVSFTTGTIDMKVSPDSAGFRITNMAPADIQFAALSLSNGGSFGLRYTVAASTSNAAASNLAGQLDAEVRKVSGSCNASTFTASSDTIVTRSKLDVVTSLGPRRIAAGERELACLKVSLPVDSGNQYRNATTTAPFTIDAIQAENNS